MLSDSDSDSDGHTKRSKKKVKYQYGSGTPSMSKHDFEEEKAKRIAKNKSLLLKTTNPLAVEEIEDIVDQEPKEHGQNVGGQATGG
jgi:hypothetical protein